MLNTAEAFRVASAHHQAGRLREAETAYRQILEVDPAHAEALHLLGLVAHQLGQYEDAIRLMREAILLAGDQAAFHFNLGSVYLAHGQCESAIACYREATRLQPQFVAAHSNLGAALNTLGRPRDALVSFRKALAIQPDSAEFQFNLGSTFHALDERAEAAAAYREALRLKPDYVDAIVNLADLLRSQDRLDEALTCCRRAIELQPNSAEAHNNLGAVLAKQKKLDEAAESYRRALELKPDFAAAHNNLGAVLEKQEKLDEAAACCRRALEIDPDFAEAHNNLATVLRSQNKLSAAVASCRRALELKPDDAAAHGNLGAIFEKQGRFDEAAACYRRSLELAPDDADVHLNLGTLHEEMGERAEAEAAYRRALLVQPDHALPHARLAAMLRGKLPAADLAALEQRLVDPELDPTLRARLLFALGQTLDARGDYAGAADHLRQANTLTLEVHLGRREYDPAADERFFEGLAREFDGRFFARVAGAGLNTRRPVFVFGLPRSGTTLIEQILASHSRVHGAGELSLASQTFQSIPALIDRADPPLDCVAQLDAGAIGRLAAFHLDGLRAIDGGRADRIVDKMPSNYQYLGLLAAMFPQAVLIHCRRDLRDVAASCWMTDFGTILWANHPAHIASHFRQYCRIMDHWRAVLPVPIVDIDYEDTVANLEPVARRLVAACGLQWEPACLEFHRTRRPVLTASVSQVREPIYRNAVGRWTNYEHTLADLFAALPPRQEQGGCWPQRTRP